MTPLWYIEAPFGYWIIQGEHTDDGWFITRRWSLRAPKDCSHLLDLPPNVKSNLAPRELVFS